jgi:hypothetical protein
VSGLFRFLLVANKMPRSVPTRCRRLTNSAKSKPRQHVVRDMLTAISNCIKQYAECVPCSSWACHKCFQVSGTADPTRQSVLLFAALNALATIPISSNNLSRPVTLHFPWHAIMRPLPCPYILSGPVHKVNHKH